MTGQPYPLHKSDHRAATRTRLLVRRLFLRILYLDRLWCGIALRAIGQDQKPSWPVSAALASILAYWYLCRWPHKTGMTTTDPAVAAKDFGTNFLESCERTRSFSASATMTRFPYGTVRKSKAYVPTCGRHSLSYLREPTGT